MKNIKVGITLLLCFWMIISCGSNSSKSNNQNYNTSSSEDGYNEDGYDEDGYDEDGYDEDGYNEDGYNEDGYNEDGYNEDGYDEDGYDEDGYDSYGHVKDGTYTATVRYHNPATGYYATYTLDVEVENGEVTIIYFPNDGYLDNDHITPSELDRNGYVEIDGEEGKTYEVQIDF